jgi:hypothetical protein
LDIKTIHRNIEVDIIRVDTALGVDSGSNVEESFDSFLNSFMDIEGYRADVWDVSKTSNWWRKFEGWGNSEYSSYFLSQIRERLEHCDIKHRECLRWLEIELQASQRKNTHLVVMEQKTRDLVAEYPRNIEFTHYLAQLIHVNSSFEGYNESRELYSQCSEAWRGKAPKSFIRQFANYSFDYINYLMQQGELSKAKEEIEWMRNHPVFSSVSFANMVVVYRDRINDRIQYAEEISKVHVDYANMTRELVNEQNKKSIELLSLFSAIIAFVVSTAFGVTNGSIVATPVTLIAVGLVLVLMVSTASLFNSSIINGFWWFKLLLLAIFACITLYYSSVVLKENNSKVDSTSITIMSENESLIDSKPSKKSSDSISK